ncbi:MAG: DUF1553 domain-containing protein [Planctomycetaceae bacterium]|nr:DUF1553 domain-containing protein [Planctomycetaceae bacterium]
MRPALCILVIAATAAADEPTFNKDIRPILADKCFHCHGPDANTREADLRLDEESAAKASRDGLAAIVPGNATGSQLIDRIFADDPDLQMPPPDSGRTLSEAEKATLRQWIDSGAKWEQHWSFITPQRPAVPTVDSDWPHNAIDHFVLRRLQQAGFTHAPPTEKYKWLRKVSFDLTGLPPTLAELDAFLQDASPAAFEAVVDRLLASPHYGEHMAAAWLDAARYADTDGYQNDGPRTMYRYRDWVIEAFNANMPFDQFTIEQLAGDLLPNATLSQQIATGFNRNHRYNSEAGLVLEEFLLENAVDRVDTTSTVWMGLTLGCARCHDHKYDTFSQEEYYQLISFFDNIAESGRAIKFGNSEPWIVAPTSAQQQQLQTLQRKIVNAQTALSKAKTLWQNAEPALNNWLSAQDENTPCVPNGLTDRFLFEEMKAEGIRVESGSPVLREGLHGKSATVGGNGVLLLGDKGNVTCQGRSSVCFWMKAENTESGVVLSRQKKSSTRPGFCVMLDDGRLQFQIVTRWISGVGTVETKRQISPNEWVHVTLTNDGSQRARGQQIWLNGQLADTRIVHNTNSNTGGTSKGAPLRIGGGVVGDRFAGQVDDLHFYSRTLFADEIAQLAERASIREIIAQPGVDRTPSMQNKLIGWMVACCADSKSADENTPAAVQSLMAASQTLLKLRLQSVKLTDAFPTTMVMQERAVPRQTTIRVRGVYNAHGDVVTSTTPATLPALANANAKNTRHDLAKWLVSGQHPLTARVIVNRYWQKYFGTGLVATPEDFGLQGDLPSHPELLDWLAVEFVESGWNVKALQKLIVLSATYRQSSRFPIDDLFRKSALTEDPGNRLLWRGPRLRLTARQLRDQALFASGLLTTEIGGPSVSPYQPANLWAEMSNMKYRQSKGKDLYRRGLYTLWKRTVAPPGLAILDAADRENCTVRPKRTNTPLQALTLLNETTFVESARHLAVRMSSEGGDDPIRWAFRLLTCRPPSASEHSALETARQFYLEEFQADLPAAKQLLSVGESPVATDVDTAQLAADTMLCNVLLNLDEVVSRE